MTWPSALEWTLRKPQRLADSSEKGAGGAVEMPRQTCLMYNSATRVPGRPSERGRR